MKLPGRIATTALGIVVLPVVAVSAVLINTIVQVYKLPGLTCTTIGEF